MIVGKVVVMKRVPSCRKDWGEERKIELQEGVAVAAVVGKIAVRCADEKPSMGRGGLGNSSLDCKHHRDSS